MFIDTYHKIILDLMNCRLLKSLIEFGIYYLLKAHKQ